jgi:hypothetical protein
MSSQRLSRTMTNANVQHIQIKRGSGLSGSVTGPDSPNVVSNINLSHSGSLSPAIQSDINNFKDLISKCKSFSNTYECPNNNQSNKNNNNILTNISTSTIKINDSNGIDKQFLKVGNYILFETQTIDMYNTAYNVSNANYYYWKVNN